MVVVVVVLVCFATDSPGLPWVWPEVLEGYFRDKVEDVAVRTMP